MTDWDGRRKLPCAITEHGAGSPASVLKGPIGFKKNIAIV